MLTALTSLILAFLYRLRGGGYVTLGSDVFTRLIWGGGLAVAYAVQTSVNLWTMLSMLITGYVSMFIPHAYCQNMGRWATPQKRWPSFFFPSWTPAGWTAAPLWQKAVYDAGQMACVSLLRGVVVFAPVAALAALNGGFFPAVGHLIAGIVVITVLQPVAYLLGAYAMFFSVPSCTKFSAEWGEFLTGAAWGIAIAAAA